jgi:hypothetical protein
MAAARCKVPPWTVTMMCQLGRVCFCHMDASLPTDAPAGPELLSAVSMLHGAADSMCTPATGQAVPRQMAGFDSLAVGSRRSHGHIRST